MSDKVRILKINIKIGEKEISLLPDEAKELQEILNDTFEKIVYIPSNPIIIDRYIPIQSYGKWDIIWGNYDVTYQLTSNIKTTD